MHDTLNMLLNFYLWKAQKATIFSGFRQGDHPVRGAIWNWHKSCEDPWRGLRQEWRWATTVSNWITCQIFGKSMARRKFETLTGRFFVPKTRHPCCWPDLSSKLEKTCSLRAPHFCPRSGDQGDSDLVPGAYWKSRLPLSLSSTCQGIAGGCR